MTNILTANEEHQRYCTIPSSDMGPWARVGDVRWCEHGKIMVAYEVRGVIPPYWHGLSPIFNPIRYWRARRALSEA